MLLEFKTMDWLVHMRAAWVPSAEGVNSRRSVVAGRTGTRCNIGRPQPRWEEGVVLARSVLLARTQSQKGNNAVTVRTRIREALVNVRTAVQQAFNEHVVIN